MNLFGLTNREKEIFEDAVGQILESILRRTKPHTMRRAGALGSLELLSKNTTNLIALEKLGRELSVEVQYNPGFDELTRGNDVNGTALST
jgi:hypothetical protein